MEATLSCQQRIVISINDHHKAEDGKRDVIFEVLNLIGSQIDLQII
jgi:hypothetical protein